MALIISLSSYFLNETVVPWTNHKSQNVIRMITYEEQLVTVQENTFLKLLTTGISISAGG